MVEKEREREIVEAMWRKKKGMKKVNLLRFFFILLLLLLRTQTSHTFYNLFVTSQSTRSPLRSSISREEIKKSFCH